MAIVASATIAILPQIVFADGPGDEAGERPAQADGSGDEGGSLSRRPFQFALITDMPYNSGEVAQLDNLISEVNSERSLSFVLHGGDVKSGSSVCSSELLQARFDQFQKFNLPFIYTPGDNEWTDCHREAAGRFNPIERLAKVREIFYPRIGFSTGRRPQRLVPDGRNKGAIQEVSGLPV
ncbi:MAG: hypothetical protein HC886_21575 [Leptolyngbyaceae cyanobacterium SM1_1_3]|nr:hypothetical protein [Leptolyngbyaceae cyanobacterium SM1_1_3]NJO11580.1 hypothetical protein [Leptolyngbyaceae cyanobacterium SL_1_1]